MPAEPITLALDGPGVTLADAGGKGANLALLLRAGLPVPGGFVVTTAAYRRFVAAHGLDAAIAAGWAQTAGDDPAAYERAADALRRAFTGRALPSTLAGEIAAAYRALGGGAGGAVAVAVRSSATAEDLPGASFAGQQETYLNVQGEAALLDAVRRCWASLWTARAMAYRRRQGIGPGDVSLAVVVQEMAPADAAGVLFTVNPLTGDAGEMVINAAWGLGEALVAGRVNPDTYLIDKASGAVTRAEVGEKALMSVPVRAGGGVDGTAEVEVDAARRARRVLDDAQAAQLAALARTVEELFGAAQDIEWALAGGRFVLLQARPVTTSVQRSTFDEQRVSGLSDRAAASLSVERGTLNDFDDAWPPFDGEALPVDLWTQMDLGERWPEALTPLTWSTGAAMTEQSLNEQLAGVRAQYAGRLRWIKRAYGRAYLNEGGMLHVYVDGMGMPGPLIAGGMTGVGQFTPQQLGWQWGKVLRHAGLFARTFTTWERAVGRFERDFPRIDAWVGEFMARNLADEARLPDAALWREYSEVWWPRVMHYIRAHTYATSLAITAFGQVEGRAEAWLGDKALARDLAGGISGVIAAEIVPGLQGLAAALRSLGLDEAVRGLPPAAALGALRANPAAKPFLDLLDAFLHRHGHRCMSEAEFLHPRWVEAPEQVIAALHPYLDAPAQTGGAAEEGARLRRAAAEERVRALPAPRRAYLQWGVRRLHRLARVRDNGQHYLVMLLLPVRRIFAVLGERWARRGWLAAPDQIFFLVLPEIEQVCATGNPGGRNLAAIAARRRQARDYWLRHPAPDALDAQGRPVALAAAGETTAEGELLLGMAAGAGTVTGRARVVLSPAEAATLERGDILVTRSTDPGWTPVFSHIGGVVLEVGGLLSHGAIVAREYGLPAVVNLARATERIPDGATVTVDGGAGSVLVHR